MIHTDSYRNPTLWGTMDDVENTKVDTIVQAMQPAWVFLD